MHFCNKHSLEEDSIFSLNLLATGAASSSYPHSLILIQLIAQQKKCDVRIGSRVPSFGWKGGKSFLQPCLLSEKD